MDWTEHVAERLVIIKLSGEIDLQTSPKLRELLQLKAEAKVPFLLLDFSDVKYIDSSGLATLVEYYKCSSRYSGRMAVAGANNRVRSIFDLVRLSEIFEIYPSVAKASEALLPR